jgi:Rps23 Pro-64 3,4-dihydroxylase Tpa1-like proline 4-hydroxylase
MFGWLHRLPGFRAAAAVRELRAEVAALRGDVDRAEADTARTSRDLRRREAQVGHLKALRKTAPDPARLKAILKSHSDRYRSARPFPHVVLDEFIDPALLGEVLKEFDAMSRDGWHHTDKERERKWSTENVLDLGPQTRQLIFQLNAGPFLTFLERLTGIGGLIADPHLRGGGLHEIRRGGMLGVHADFNFYERLQVYRRLNLLIYLNPGWDESWGGDLELWDYEKSSCVERIAPLFNRAVIFDTSNLSYHGHPTALACPEDRSRRSIALYYYSVAYPYEHDQTPHGTVFADELISRTREHSPSQKI